MSCLGQCPTVTAEGQNNISFCQKCLKLIVVCRSSTWHTNLVRASHSVPDPHGPKNNISHLLRCLPMDFHIRLCSQEEGEEDIPQTRKEINVVRRRLLCMVCFLPKKNCFQQRTGRPTIRRGYWATVADRDISCLLSVHLRPNDNLIRWRNNLFYSNSVEARIRPPPFGLLILLPRQLMGGNIGREWATGISLQIK